MPIYNISLIRSRGDVTARTATTTLRILKNINKI